MKTILLTSAIALIMFNANSQVTTISQQPFTKIRILSSAKITLQYDTAHSVSFDDDNPDMKSVSVADSVLTIRGVTDYDLVVRLSKLNEVTLDGEGSVKGSGTFRTDDLHLAINGGGKIEMNVEAQKINAEINGLGKIVLSGTAQEANFSIPGAGKIDAFEMRTIVCNANISGMGKSMVDVIDVLNANISGNGTIVYRNTPKELNKNISGLGTIKSQSGNGEPTSSESTPDTTKIDFDNKQLWIIGEKNKEEKKRKKSSVKPFWAGFEYGLNTYMDNGGTFTLDAGKEDFELQVEKSPYISINLFQQHVELGRSNIWLLSGLGVSWNNYRFDSNVILDNDDYTNAIRDTSGVGHVKSKLVACYVTAPVMLQYFTSRKMKNAFHIGVGGIFGLRLDSYTKRKIEENDMTTKIHSHDDFNLNTFRYGFRLAVGYGKFNVFADYYASTMFKENRGPVLYPVSLGITVVGW